MYACSGELSMNKSPSSISSRPVEDSMSRDTTISGDYEGMALEGNMMPSKSSDAEVVPCRQEIFDEMQDKYDSFTNSSPRRTSNMHQEDRERSQQLRKEVAKILLNAGNPILHNNTNAITDNTHDSEEQINTVAMARLLSCQMEKFDQLLQENEQSQETILRLQQGRDWLKGTCEALQISEEKKLKKISSLERKIDSLEQLVIDMKLKEAESRSREDHYKLQIANLERLLEKSVQPRRQRRGGLKHTQSLTLPSASNASKDDPERKPPLARSFSSFFRKADHSDRSGDDPPKVDVSKSSLGAGNSLCSSASEAKKKNVPRKEDARMDITMPRPKLKTTDDILREPSKWYNPKRSSSNNIPTNDTGRGPTNDVSLPTTIPSFRETHLSNITDITDEAWDDAQIDEADRSDSSPCQAELDPPPVFEPAEPQMKLKLSFRRKGAQPEKEAQENSHCEAKPTSFLAYC